ncbi:MAG TPA: hypothetical protein V6D33_19955 [Cyanophyceae cyanobacterium]
MKEHNGLKIPQDYKLMSSLITQLIIRIKDSIYGIVEGKSSKSTSVRP